MTTVKERLSNKTTPTFFKKLRNWAGTIGTILGGVAYAVSKIPVIPPVVQTVCEIASPLLLMISGASHATVGKDVQTIKGLIPKILDLFKKKK